MSDAAAPLAEQLPLIGCCDCGEPYHSAPHPRYGLPVRCTDCADREAARLRAIATGRKQLGLEALVSWEASKRSGGRRR